MSDANGGATARSLWAATAAAAPELPELAGPEAAEVVVVGAGFSGLSTALALAEKGVATIVLEAGELGAGASGESGGQVIAGLRHYPDELIGAWGRERGRRLYEFGTATARETFALIRRLRLDCDATQAGWVQAADGPTDLAENRRRVAAWQAIGAPVHLLDRAEVRRLTGTDAYVGGWIHEDGGTVQPLSYTRGLARAAKEAGARIFVRSPATAIERVGSDWRITTPRGAVTARRVLLATNAHTGGLWPHLAETLMPVWSFQIATAPLPATAGVLASGPAVSDTRRVLSYFRRDRDGRLVVGGKGTARGPAGIGSFDLQRRTLARLYPALADGPIEFWWGGQVAITLDRLPRLFRLADGLFATLGCNGKGVAWATALGPHLAEMLCGVDPETLPLPPVEPMRRIPFHGLKRFYVAAGTTWLRFCDLVDSIPRRPLRKAEP